MKTARRLLICAAAAALAGPALLVSTASGAAAAEGSGSGTTGTPSVAASGPEATSPTSPGGGSGSQSTVTCSGNSCTGQKPELTGCDKDGQTIRTGRVLDSAGKVVGTIELRWSAACQSNWARVTSQVGVQPLIATVTRDDARSAASDFQGTQTWSPLVFVGSAGKAQATGWIGKASGSIADGAPAPGRVYQ